MTESLRRYLAEIGARGGRKSRRTLDRATARSMVRSREARRAIRRTAELDRQRLRRMTAAEKLRVMDALWRQAWSLAAAGIRARHPQWDESRVQEAVREAFRRDSG